MFLVLVLLAGLQGIVAAQTRPLTSREFGAHLSSYFESRHYSKLFDSNEVIGLVQSTPEAIVNEHEGPRLPNKSLYSPVAKKSRYTIVLDSEKCGESNLKLSFDKYTYNRSIGCGEWINAVFLWNIACSGPMKDYLIKKLNGYHVVRANEIINETKLELDQEIQSLGIGIGRLNSKLASLPESVVNIESSVNNS